MRPDGTHPGPRPGPRLVTVGIGSCAGVTAEEVHGLVTAVLFWSQKRWVHYEEGGR